ncbi:MAG: Hsp33 family molecular chaperone HslO [Gammaproteobacteria bacterium]
MNEFIEVEQDCLHRFIFEQTNIRGELVHLDETCQSIFENQDYPLPVQLLLGELLAAAALLSATIKISGSLHLQLQGDGPVSLLLVQAGADRALRGVAKWEGVNSDDGFNTLIKNARLSITIDPGEGGERYQGLVEVVGDSLAAALENYFQQSEQLKTRLWLAADEASAGGLLLQQLPGETDDLDAWSREAALSETVTNDELLTLPAMTLLHRLFHEENVRVFKAEAFRFYCACSRERIESVLRGLGAGEVHSIIKEQGAIDVQCEFCGKQYVFDTVDAQSLFVDISQSGSASTKH